MISSKIFLHLFVLLTIPLTMIKAESIAAINLEQVFVNSTLVEHRSAQLRALGQEVQTKLKAMDEELKGLETELQIRPPSHPRYGEFREQFEVAKLRRDLYRERQASRLNNSEMELLRQSYEDMHQLLSEFALERKLSLVFLVSSGPIEASAVQGLRIQMGQRAVLYAAPELDMTADFTAFANSRFRGANDGAADEKTEQPSTPVEGVP